MVASEYRWNAAAMDFYALSASFDSVYEFVHEAGSDNDVYGEGVDTDKRHMKQRVAEAGSNERHAGKS